MSTSSIGQGIGVMQLTDTLAAGGLERVAVNLANLLPERGYRSFLGTTRAEGALTDALETNVGRLSLMRRRRFDIKAVLRLRRFIRSRNIRILHAHGSSILMANLTALGSRQLRIIWHDHFGRYATEKRPELLFRLLTRQVSGVVAVNQPLLNWTRERLCVSPDRAWYLPNFVVPSPQNVLKTTGRSLPGVAGKRLVCVANMRPQKDLLNLVDAMDLVVRKHHDAHLICVGTDVDKEYARAVKRKVRTMKQDKNITFWGPSNNVPEVLSQCDVAVLSSSSEGLPLALLEYGASGLATVATDVGQCGEVLDHGRVGKLVPPGQSEVLARELIGFLDSKENRTQAGGDFQLWVREQYSPESAIQTLDRVYRYVLGTP